MKVERKERWYARRLSEYFMDHYGEYEDSAEWFNDPAINQWLCYIPELDMNIELTCSNYGVVSEDRFPLVMDTSRAYDLVKRNCEGMDAIYEDYLIELIGATGIGLLRSARLLETCGVINGRQLYVLCDGEKGCEYE